MESVVERTVESAVNLLIKDIISILSIFFTYKIGSNLVEQLIDILADTTVLNA